MADSGGVAVRAATRRLVSRYADTCFVPPSPELKAKWEQELNRARNRKSFAAEALGLQRKPRYLGFDDGVILPPEEFPFGTSLAIVRSAAMDRAPLRGSVRVIVILCGFSDHAMAATASHFQDLFFSTGVLPHGSVKEYYTRGHERPGHAHRRRRRPVPDAADPGVVRQQQLRDRQGRRRLPVAPAGPRRGRRGGPDRQLPAVRQRRQRLRRRVHRRACRRRRRGHRQQRRHLVAQGDHVVGLQHRQHQDLRLPDDPRGRQDRRLRARAGAPAVRLPRPVRHGLHLRRHRQLVPHVGRQLERRRRRPRARVRLVQGEPGLGVGHQRDDEWLGDHPRRQGEPQRPAPVEGRDRRPGVLPRREPAEDGLRRRPAG